MLEGLMQRCGMEQQQLVVIRPLTLQQRKAMVHRWHDEFMKTVDEAIMRPLWEAPQCANPLFLSLALRHLVLSGSFNQFKAHGCSELLRAETVPQLMQQLLGSIAQSFTIKGQAASDIVKDLLCSVYCR